MIQPIRQSFWRIIVVLLVLIGLGAPALSASAAQQRSSGSGLPMIPPSGSDGGTALSTATIAPADTQIYFAINLDFSSPQYVQTEALAQRAGFGDLLDFAVETVDSELSSAEDNLQALLDGELAIAVTNLNGLADTANDGSSGQLMGGVVVILRTTDGASAAGTARELLSEVADDNGLTVTETDYNGVLIHDTSPAGDPSYGGVGALASVDDFLIFGMSVGDVESVIDVAQGNAETLADQASFQQVREQLPSDFLMYGYLDGSAYAEMMEAGLAASGMNLAANSPFAELLPQLNVYYGEVFWADEAGFRTDTITIPISGELPNNAANFPSSLAAQVPGDSVIFVDSFDLGPSLAPSFDMINWTVQTLLDEDPSLQRELPPFVIDAIQSSDLFTVLGKLLAFNPQTDLANQFVGEWAFALSVRGYSLDDIAAIFISGTDDVAVLTDTTAKLAVWLNLIAIGALSQSGYMSPYLDLESIGAHTEQIDGSLTQVVEIPVPQADSIVRLQWGVLDGQFVFGVGDGFSDYQEGQIRSLADNAIYQTLMAELPSEHNGVLYIDVPTLLEFAEPLIRQQFEMEFGVAATDEWWPDLSGIQSYGAVTFERDGMQGTSSLLMIAP